MRKKIGLIAGSIIGITVPIATVISCGGDTSTHIISKDTQKFLENKLKEIKDPLGDLIVGKPLAPVHKDLINQKLKEITSSVEFDQLIIYKNNKTTGQKAEAFIGEVILENYEYSLGYLLQPVKNTKWEDGKDQSGPREFAQFKKDSIKAQAIIDVNHFKNLTFSNLDDILKNRMPVKDLIIDDSKKSWKDKVSIRYIEFYTENIATPGLKKPIEMDASVPPGSQLTVDIAVTPVGELAWTDGKVDEKILKNSVSGKVQFKVSAEDFKIRYTRIISKKAINVNLFPGYFHSQAIAQGEQGESYVELYYSTTKEENKSDPEKIKDYKKIDNWQPPWLKPEINKIYDDQEIDLNSELLDTNKYANFKLVYKNYFKSSKNAPYSWYDITNTKLPYDKPTVKNKIIREDDDLVSYTYSIPYKLY